MNNTANTAAATIIETVIETKGGRHDIVDIFFLTEDGETHEVAHEIHANRCVGAFEAAAEWNNAPQAFGSMDQAFEAWWDMVDDERRAMEADEDQA